MKVTREQCERAVKRLQESGYIASYEMGAPDDHGVWLDIVWNSDLQEDFRFRIHNEEIVWWSTLPPLKTQTKDK